MLINPSLRNISPTRKVETPSSTTASETQPLFDNDEEQGTEVLSDAKDKRIHPLAVLRFAILLLSNIAAWYLTNGFNGIALQSYAKRIWESEQTMSLLSAMSTMAIVTALQLGFGACIGYSLLCIISFILQRNTPSLKSMVTLDADELISGSLHGVGSICTNLGFMFGSASLVQILKLLEPFETLALSQLVIPEEGRITQGVVSSMLVLVGAAVSLIRIRPDPPHPYSVMFAILSGCTLSCRNVLQRRQHRTATVQDTTPDTQLAKMERSIQQFTKLSLQSCFMSILASIVLHYFSPATSNVMLLNWKVLTWHPLYNIFSMITLGFCSALTHSLLNAGKRVFAIFLAILWFGESMTLATGLGLLTVMGGGAWYSTESKQRSKGGWHKVGVAVLVLGTLLHVQTKMMKES